MSSCEEGSAKTVCQLIREVMGYDFRDRIAVVEIGPGILSPIVAVDNENEDGSPCVFNGKPAMVYMLPKNRADLGTIVEMLGKETGRLDAEIADAKSNSLNWSGDLERWIKGCEKDIEKVSRDLDNWASKVAEEIEGLKGDVSDMRLSATRRVGSHRTKRKTTTGKVKPKIVR